MNIVTREFKVSKHPEYSLYAVEEVVMVFGIVLDRHYHGEGGFYFTDIRKASVLKYLLEEQDELKCITILENRFAIFMVICLAALLLLQIIKY